MIALTHDRVLQEIPFGLICEAHESARWDSGKRRRLWNEQFTKSEKDTCTRLFAKARDWSFVHGVPDVVHMSKDTYELWIRLGEFCAML